MPMTMSNDSMTEPMTRVTRDCASLVTMTRVVSIFGFENIESNGSGCHYEPKGEVNLERCSGQKTRM